MTNLIPWVLAAGVSLSLLGLFAVFRWRYSRLVKATIYAGIVSPVTALPTVTGADRVPLQIHWSDADSTSEVTPSVELAEALAATRVMRRALLAAGAVHIFIETAVVWAGQRHQGPGAATFIAYANTAPGIVLMLAFARTRWTQYVGIVAAWLALDLLLAAGLVGWKVGATLKLVEDQALFSLLPLVFVGPLLLRAMRALIVGFAAVVVPIFVLLLVLYIVFGLKFEGGIRPWIIPIGLFNLVAGFGIVVRQLRGSVQPRLVGLVILLGLAGVFCWVAWPQLPLGAILVGIPLNAVQALGLWWAFLQVVRLQDRGWIPDELPQQYFCWLCLSPFVLFLITERSMAWGWACLPFAAYLVVLHVMLLHGRRRAAFTRLPKRMLLLRVFRGAPPRNRLFDLLDDTWRRVGRIDLAVGPDTGLRTLSARTLEYFLLGRLGHQFIQAKADVHQRLANLPLQIGIDGRYPLNEVHCLPDTWQDVVTWLTARADIVLMDLREFHASNTGAIFELVDIVQRVPLSRIVLLTDPRTDEQLLLDVIHQAWTQLPEDSPNRGVREAYIELLRCSGSAKGNHAIANAVFAAAFGMVGRLVPIEVPPPNS